MPCADGNIVEGQRGLELDAAKALAVLQREQNIEVRALLHFIECWKSLNQKELQLDAASALAVMHRDRNLKIRYLRKMTKTWKSRKAKSQMRQTFGPGSTIEAREVVFGIEGEDERPKTRP